MKLIGIDFDNTIVVYDNLFYRIALEKRLIPEDIKKIRFILEIIYVLKIRIMNSLFCKASLRKRILEAKPAPNIFDTLQKIKENFKLIIISHKTKYPYSGTKYDLHKSALLWLVENNFLSKEGLNIRRDDIYFEPTKEKKLSRIRESGCSYFIDDLPEILSLINSSVFRIHYTNNQFYENNQFEGLMSDWKNLQEIIDDLIMEYKNFEKFFRFLRENDFKIINFEEIRSGRNSLTLKLFCEKQVLFLKKYKSNFYDDRDRLNSEKKFLNLLSLENFDNVPKPILFSEEYNFSLLSWIDGESINKPEISDWNQFLEFLSDVRKINNKKSTYFIENASEACFDMVGHINLVEQSIINLIQLLKKKITFYEINNWLSKNLLMPIQEIKKLENKSDGSNKMKNKSVNRILSQSDIGFHNIIKSKNKLYFFDFEYFGMILINNIQI